MLDRLAARAVPGHEPSRGAGIDLTHEHLTHLRLVGALHLIPHLPVRIAEAREGAQALRVRQRHRRALHELRLLAVGFAARALGAIEADLLMAAVAEGLVPGMAAATQS